MKARLALCVLVVGFVPAAMAERMGSGGGFMYGTDWKPDEAPASAPAAAPVAVKRPPVEIKIPAERLPQAPQASPVAPQAGPVVQGQDIYAEPLTGDVPFRASVKADPMSCPDPVHNPNARNTPVKIFVDQATQQVTISSPDLPQPVVSVTSTGGGLKVPNGKIKKDPYCARTPKRDRKIISAVTPDMFKGTGCSAEEIRRKSTVFPLYHTSTFTNEKGERIPMPHAVRIEDGIFFHKVPNSYKKLLGQNVSGECVRLPEANAVFIEAQIRKYGAVEVTITEAPEVPRSKPQYCDDEMKLAAKARQDSATQTALNAPPATGSEGVYGGEDNFFKALAKINPLDPKKLRVDEGSAGGAPSTGHYAWTARLVYRARNGVA